MKKALMKKIVNSTLKIIGESLYSSKDPMQIKTYAMAKTAIEMNVPLEDVEYCIEAYRQGDLRI